MSATQKTCAASLHIASPLYIFDVRFRCRSNSSRADNTSHLLRLHKHEQLHQHKHQYCLALHCPGLACTVCTLACLPKHTMCIMYKYLSSNRWLCWGGQNAFMNCWWFSVHSYCWTCGFQGPLGGQGAVGCPLATTHVNHFLRGFVGVNLLGVDC